MLQLIVHLHKNYAYISNIYMAENDEHLRSLYNPQETLESLIERLNNVFYYAAAAGKPVKEIHLGRILYGIFADIGV